MKITGAFIYDPTFHNKIDFPELVVEVDDWPDVSIRPEKFAGGWTVGKYGPFVKYSCDKDREVDAGDFNVRFRERFPSVVDITLRVTGGIDQGDFPTWALPLSRARQLVRKFDPDWRLTVSDRAAERGSILWLPTQVNPSCRAWLGKDNCGSRPARPIRVNEVDMPLCEAHVREHNERHAQKRTARAS